jgi:hypothetical protein
MEIRPNMITRTLLFVTAALSIAPAFGQIDLSGTYARREHQDWQERVPGPEAVDYLGLPINDEARTRALSYMASMLSMPEHQCLYYTPQYVVYGPQALRLWAETDPVSGKTVAWKISAAVDRAVLTIWMDGRPHPPPYAPHSFAGFTTGIWEGDTLTTYTTHIKAGYIRRNGTPSSDEATLTEHIRRHGDVLTITALLEDPVYLTEPYVISRSWQLDPKLRMSETPPPCSPQAEVPRLPGDDGSVPHYLPGENPFVNEMTRMYNIPAEAVMGGAETAYPEYRRKLKANYVPPAKCVRYCCGWEGNAAQNTLKDCIGRGFGLPVEQNGGR